MFSQSTIDMLNGKQVTYEQEPKWQEILPEILECIHQCDISIIAHYVNSIPGEEKLQFIDRCAFEVLNPNLDLDFDNIVELMNGIEFENAVSQLMTRMKKYYELLFQHYSNEKYQNFKMKGEDPYQEVERQIRF